MSFAFKHPMKIKYCMSSVASGNSKCPSTVAFSATSNTLPLLVECIQNELKEGIDKPRTVPMKEFLKALVIPFDSLYEIVSNFYTS